MYHQTNAIKRFPFTIQKYFLCEILFHFLSSQKGEKLPVDNLISVLITKHASNSRKISLPFIFLLFNK
jgi:hypothetical protein